jgi:hypothetical protein
MLQKLVKVVLPMVKVTFLYAVQFLVDKYLKQLILFVTTLYIAYVHKSHFNNEVKISAS